MPRWVACQSRCGHDPQRPQSAGACDHGSGWCPSCIQKAYYAMSFSRRVFCFEPKKRREFEVVWMCLPWLCFRNFAKIQRYLIISIKIFKYFLLSWFFAIFHFSSNIIFRLTIFRPPGDSTRGWSVSNHLSPSGRFEVGAIFRLIIFRLPGDSRSVRYFV